MTSSSLPSATPWVRRPAPARAPLAHLAVAVIAGGLGLLAGVEPLLAALATMAVLAAVLAFVDMALALALFAIAASLEALPGLGGGVTAAKLLGALVVGSWFVSVLLRQQSRPVFFKDRGWFTALVLSFLLWGAATLLWADNVNQGAEDLSRFALNAILLPVAYAALRERRDALLVVAAVVAATAVAAAWGFAVPSGEDRLGGGAGNPNTLGMFLVVGVSLAAALAVPRRQPAWARAFATGAMVFGAIALFATGSRGAILGITAALLVTIFSSERRRLGRSLLLAAVVVGAALTYYSALAPAEIRDRVQQTEVDSGSGRLTLWTVGGRMIASSPVGGVGIGQFRESLPEYGLRPGYLERTDHIFDDLKVAHSFYLQIWTETGTVGLLLFLGVVGYALRAAARARHVFRRMGDVQMELVSRGLLAALSGVLAAGFFSSQVYSKMLWLVIALCVAVSGVAYAMRDRVEASDADSPAGG